MSIYKIVFRIKQEFFNEIVKGNKQIEYRADTAHWRKRVLPGDEKTEVSVGFGAIFNEDINDIKWIGIFLCGKQKHMREIKSMTYIETPSEVKHIIKTPRCFAFHLGEEIKQ
jgi:hypothetical protein